MVARHHTITNFDVFNSPFTAGGLDLGAMRKTGEFAVGIRIFLERHVMVEQNLRLNLHDVICQEPRGFSGLGVTLPNGYRKTFEPIRVDDAVVQGHTAARRVTNTVEGNGSRQDLNGVAIMVARCGIISQVHLLRLRVTR